MISSSENTVLDKPANLVTVDKGFQILVPADWKNTGSSFKSIDSSLAILDCSTLLFNDNDSMRRSRFEPVGTGTTIRSTKQIHFANLDGQSYELLIPAGQPIDYMLVYSLYGDKKSYLVIFSCKKDDYEYANYAIEAILNTLKPI
jgi:hypothetical protein